MSAPTCGTEARLYIRGALDSRYTTPEARDRCARAIARQSPTLAAAFLRGWVESHQGTRQPLVWHRYIGGIALEVAA